MSKFMRMFVGLAICLLIFGLERLDVLFYLANTEGTLVKADRTLSTKKLSRSQVEYAYQAIDIQYKFEVSGRIYDGYSPFFGFMGWRNSADTSNFLATVYTNRKYRIWYDARNPNHSWLFWNWQRLFWVFGVLLVGLGIIISAFFVQVRIRGN